MREEGKIRGSLRVSQTVDYVLRTAEGEGPWPLLLVIHGFGQTAEDFSAVFAPLSERGILVAAPQAPHPFYLNLGRKEVGFTWLTRYQRDRSVQDLVAYLESFQELLSSQYRLSGKTFVLGFSQGVSIAYRLWLHGRLDLSGLIACGGDLPPDVEEGLGRKPPLPIRLQHGTDDRMVPLAKPRYALRRLEESGFPVELREFPGAGHHVSSKMVEDAGDFVLSPIFHQGHEVHEEG